MVSSISDLMPLNRDLESMIDSKYGFLPIFNFDWVIEIELDNLGIKNLVWSCRGWVNTLFSYLPRLEFYL